MNIIITYHVIDTTIIIYKKFVQIPYLFLVKF